MKKLFWHIAQTQPEDGALAFEIVEIDKIIPYPKGLDQEIYHKLIKNCLAQSDFDTLPALLEGAITLEEFEHAEFIKQRMKKRKILPELRQHNFVYVPRKRLPTND